MRTTDLLEPCALPIKALRPKHVAKYLAQRADDGAAVRGNREKALLSHCFTKAMVEGWVDGNPCRGVHRNREQRRERQGKTGKALDIEVTGELEKLVGECLAEPVVPQTFVHRDDGKRYSYAGLSAMFRRYVKKCGLNDFGLYDLKGKAATDMYRAGVPLEQRQHVLGHASIKTTEIYIKARLPDLVAPTSRPLIKQQARDGK